jgi:DNA-binding LacI/PurR family transcriptional regulator
MVFGAGDPILMGYARLMTVTSPKKTPRYEVIATELTREIRSSTCQPHELFITLEEICERFSTSMITAQRAVQEMIKLGVVYSKRGSGTHIAPLGRRTPSKLIAFLFHGIVDDGALPLVINGAEALARELKYNMILCNAQGDLDISHEYVTRLLDQHVDGVLLDLPTDEDLNGPLHELIHRFESEQIPVVLVQKRFLDESEPSAYVVADNYGGTYKAIEHLYSLGHRRIAGIFELFNSGGIERLEGYRGAVLKLGAAYQPGLVKTIQGFDDCRPIIDELFTAASPPTAIFCIHDLVAREVIRLIQERGLRVPQDVAIAGFDDLPFSGYLTPPLTTVRQPLELIGRESMRILYRRMEKDFNYREKVRLETKLIVRESCGAHLGSRLVKTESAGHQQKKKRASTSN